MLEVKINIQCPELAAALTSLADAFARKAPGVQLPVGTPTSPMVPPAATPAPGMAQSTPYAAAASTPAPTSAPPAGQMAPTVPQMPAAPVVPLSAPPVGSTPVPPSPAAPAVPVASAPAYTLDQISRAGAALVDAGKGPQLVALLGEYGVQAVTQLSPDRYGDFATKMRGLGARL